MYQLTKEEYDEYIDITSKDMEIIYHARKSLHFVEKYTWMKKQSSLF